MLPGVKIIEVSKNIDERGFFSEILRTDWIPELIGEDRPVQANLSVSYPGIVRAWHRHMQGQVDYFLVIQGSVKLCAYDDKLGLDQIICSSERLQLVRIPGKYWHGFKNIGNNRSYLVYFVNRLYDYNNPDEERRPWDDPSITDSATNKRFDWNFTPNK